jgi:hypothetical protein
MNEQLAQLYVIHTEAITDYLCQACTNNWVIANGLEWANDHSLNYVKENEKGLTAWVDFFGEIESDYPLACGICDMWLDVRLTNDGENYIRENYDTMPKHVIEYYRIEKDQD